MKLAGGEGAHNVHMARHLIDYRRRRLRPDRLRPHRRHRPGEGGRRLRGRASGVTFVNHTFTSHLALSASLQPYAGLKDHRICEYPVRPEAARARAHDERISSATRDGEIAAPDAPGLGIEIDPAGVRKYLVDVEIKVAGRTLYRTPAVD